MRTETIRKFLEYALIICIILDFNTVYMASPIFKQAVRILPVPVLLYLIMITPQMLSKKINAFIIAYLIGALFPMLNIGSDSYMGYIKTYIIILPLFWVYLSKRKAKGCNAYLSLFFKYSNVMTLFAGASLVMWLLCSILQIIPMTNLVPYAWGDGIQFVPSYYNIYFETQTANLFGESIIRNDSFFNEGPMHNMALCVALTIEYFMRTKKSKMRITILSISIITTLTTTGQLFLLALLTWHVFNISTKRYRALIVILAPIIIFAVYTIVTIVMDFKDSEALGESSVLSRAKDIQNCIEAGIKHPILGVGIVQSKDIILWHGYQLGYSNSFFAVFARGGLYTLTLYLGSLLIIPLIYYRKYKQLNWLLTMFFFFGIFAITVSFLRYLTLLFMAWGLSNLDFNKWMTNQKR